MSVLEWASYRSAKACIGLAPGIVEGITSRGVDADDTVMIPNGCDLDLFVPEEGERPSIEGYWRMTSFLRCSPARMARPTVWMRCSMPRPC